MQVCCVCRPDFNWPRDGSRIILGQGFQFQIGIMAPNEPKDSNKKTAQNEAKAARLMAGGKARPGLKGVKPGVAGATIGGLKTKDLIDTVAAATGAKKPEVKKIVEATLLAIAKALATGNDMLVPPLGKVRVVKDNGVALTLKLRLADEAKATGLALADEDEDS